MSDQPKISLRQQEEALVFACTRTNTLAQGGSVKSARPKSAEDYDLQRLQAAVRTLKWFQAHEAEIKAFMALPEEARAAVVSHGPLVAELAIELARREAIAKGGGPVR